MLKPEFNPLRILFYTMIVPAVLLSSACLPGQNSSEQNNSEQNNSEPANTLTREEADAGWILLFNGETLDGWRGHGRDGLPDGHWQVDDGNLMKIATADVERAEDGQPLRGGDLLYNRPFENFELSFEWKVSPEGNSGIKYNVSNERASANSSEPSYGALGFEYQILDDDHHPDGDPNILTAGLYDLIPPGTNAELNPAGSWNTGRILYNGNYGAHWLNGEKVLEYELETNMMNRLLQTSKWGDLPDFGNRRSEGYIVLQDHGDSVWYRNIKLREL
ncbi:MAG: DUF1080 domain-containing protein [Balneolaceae bacterium]